MEFRAFEVSEHRAGTERAASVLTTRLARETDPARIDAILTELSGSIGRGLLLVGPRGELLGASAAELRSSQIELGPGGRSVITIAGHRGALVEQRRVVLVGAPRAV